MNLDSLSFSLSQISYLVANLTKKNFKQSTTELLSLVERHGAEAERHLFRCLFSWIDFGGDGKSTGKDYHQIQLLLQEFSALLTRPTFITTTCHSIENPLSHQKSLTPSSNLISNISRVLHFSKVQEIALAISLQHSSQKDLQKIASNTVQEKFPVLLQLCSSNNSEGRKAAENEIGLQDIPVEVLHLLLTYLASSTSVESNQKQSFINLLRKDFPADRCPLVLLPFLFEKEEDIHFEKLLADSSVSTIMTSSNSVGQKLSTNMSLADIIRESGFTSCSSVEECRKLLQHYKFRNINAATVAKVLTMMAKTTSSNLDSVPLLQSLTSGNVWGDKDKNDDQQSGWNVDNFMQVAKELNNSLSARDVLMEFDFPGFSVEDGAGFKLLVRALRLLLGQHESLPVDQVFRTWNNTKGQISWLQQCIRNPHIFPIGESISRPVNLEVLKQPVDEESLTSTWKSLDLHDCLLRLSEFGLYSEVRALYDWPYSHCPDLLALALVQVGVTTRNLHHDLVCSLVPVFLGSHPNSAIVLNYMWNAQSQPNSVLRQLIIRSIAEWYTSYDQYDQQKLSRILDIAQDLKALPFLLNSTPFSFVIDLAVLASRREYLKLDKWLSDKMLEHREEFIQACVSFLKRRCPSILVRPILKEELSQTINLPVETLITLLLCLRTWIGNVSQEVADQIVTMLTNCNAVISKNRQPPPGVMNKPPAPQNVPPAPQPVIPTPPTLPAAPSNIETMLNKPIDPVLSSSGFGGNKSMLPGQNPLSAFGQSNDFIGQAPTNNRMPSAIGSNNTGGSNISSPAGAGILPPHSGVSDVGMPSVLGNSGGGGMGPIGGSNNPGGQFLGGSGGGFSSSIAQSLTSPLAATGNNNSFGLGGGQPTSSSNRFGASQTGFSSDTLSQGFSSNPLFSNISNVSGLASGSDVFSSNKLDLLPNQKQTDVFRNKMQDIFSQHKTGIDSLGMGGSGFGASFGGGITSSGLEMFGQKKPPTSGMLNPAAQQAFQQAAAKPNKQPISDFSQVSPEMNQQFSKEIEDEANGYFQRIYNQPPHPTLTVDAILDLLQNFKDSNNTKEKEVFNCMMRNLFEEYRFFPQYPDKELHITACLFGGIIDKNLVTYIPLGIALRYVLDALRKPTNNKMYFLFGIAALDRFKNKLKDYPQYCGHITAIPHFKEFPAHLIEAVENGRRSDDTLNASVGGSSDALGITGPQQPLNTLPPVGEGANLSTTGGPSTANPLPGRSTSAGPKISLPAAVGKEIQQPSIAKATNIDTLLGAKAPEEEIPVPPENVQDKIAFIFNNLSVSNMTPKSNEMRDTLKEDYLPWLAQYLVMKRVSIEPNFHLLYSNFLDCLKMPRLNKLVQEEVYRNITVLLQSDKVAANFSDRSLLKNLGHFLGIISLAKNQPILYEDIALKPLLYEAHTKGAQELLYVVPFVAKVLESVGKSRVFKLPNPWTEALMSVLKELHMEPDLKLNLKFEVEVLCKNLQMDINDIKPVRYLRDPQVKFSIECQLSTTKKELTTKPSTPSETSVRTATPMIMGLPGPGLNSNFPPPSVPPPPPAPPQPQQPQQQQPPMQMNSFTPRFSFHDINLYSFATLQSHLTIKSDIPLLQSQPQLKGLVRPAMERTVSELITMVSERTIKVTLQTSEQVIRKDFALDPEEHRMRTAAQNMVRNLTAGMALITCREQLQLSLQNYLKQAFMQAVGRSPQTLTPQQKELIEQAANIIASDNVELGCCYIQKHAVEKALLEMDKRMHNDFEFRKQARQEGRRYCDPNVLTYQAERMPEQIRLKVGGVSPQQIVVYEEFSRNIPGFLPSNDSTQPSGFLSKPMQNWPVDEISQVYDRCIREFDQYMQSFSSKQGTPQYAQLLNLREALHVARNSREAPASVSLLQKAVEGLLDPTTQPGSESEVFPAPVLARYRDCHLLVLKTLQDERAYGAQWTNKHVTQCLINHNDDYKYNIELVEKLIRANFINMQLYDQNLAQALENGMNYLALRFAIQLVKLFLVDDRQGTVTEADFFHTIEVLNKISRGQAPEGLPQLMELIRSNYDTMLDKAPGGVSHMMHTGISQAREYDDPQGLHEKTEVLLREWVNIYHSPTSGRDSTRGFATFVHQMHQNGILRTDDLITRFFRLCTEMCVDLSYRLLQESNVSPSLVNPTLVRAKCFHTLDAFVRLITLLVKHSGDAVNSVTKINLLNKVLGIVVGVLLQDHETRQMDYHQMPYHRIFIMLFYELNAPEHVLESINFQTLTAFTNTYHILRPSKAPGFAFAWLELISYRAFISRMLLHTPQQKGWPMYAQLLIDLFKFLAPFLRNVELTKSVQILYKGTLRLLLVLLHDFPEFLCDYHYGFCDVIPANCIQLRNLILSAFPRNMRLPDPFTPNLKVDMLQEINNAPRILTNFITMMPAQFLSDLDSYLKTRAPVTFLTELRTNLQRSNEAGTKYNISLINSLVMHVGTQAIQYIRSKGGSPSMASVTHSSHMDIFQNLAVDLDTEGRYLFLNAIANQLRYPNSHTHYFSCTLLYLFAETNQESIQEQITRVLLERLIVNRPHPWGLLITFIELIKNPNFKFWSHEFVHCAPEISKLFESVARSCMGKQFNQQSGTDVPTSTSPVTVATAVPSS